MAWTYYTSRQHHRRKKLNLLGEKTQTQPTHQAEQQHWQQSQCFRSSNCVRLNKLFVAVFICSLLVLKCPSGGINAQVCVCVHKYISHWIITHNYATNRQQYSYEFVMAILLKK